MRKVLFALLLCCLSCIYSYAQPLSDQQTQNLGIDQSALQQLQSVYTGGESSANRGLSITKVLFANAAGNRQLWRIDFAGDFPADNSNVIFYIDTDNNPQTGRKNVGGTDLMVWVENGKTRTAFYEPDGSHHSGPPAFAAIAGNQLYLSVDIDLHQQNQKLDFRMMAVANTNTPLTRISGTPLFAVNVSTNSTTEKLPRGGTKITLPVLAKPLPFTTDMTGWRIVNENGSKSTFSIEPQNILRIQKSNSNGNTNVQSYTIAVSPKTTYQISAQLKNKITSAANVYFSIKQFAGNNNSGGTFSSPVRPLYNTNGNWQNLSFYLTTAEKVDRVEINLVFADAPIDVSIKNVQLNRIDLAHYKPRYEPPTPETLMPLADAEKVLLSRPRATAEVRKVGARPRLFVDGKETVPLFYKSPSAYKLQRAQFKDFANAGVRVYFIPYFLGRGVYQTQPIGGWIGKDKVDFSELKEILWQVLRADPHGYIMLDLYTDPYVDWGAEHPDDVVTNEKGQKAIVTAHDLRWGGQPQKTTGSYAERYGQSYVSAQLRTDTTKVLLELDQYIKNSLPGKAVIGYYLNGGDDAQMFYWGDRTRQLTDYSKAGVAAFRDWLKARYGDNAALQKAWSRPDVTFETAEVPSGERRLKSTFFLDPKIEQDIIDYNRFHSEGTVDTRNIYAEALRKAHGTPIVIGGYYAGPTVGIPSQRATGYQLKSGQMDLLTSVTGYFATRLPGGPGKAHQAWNSLSLHDTIGVAEEDFRSWKTTPLGSYTNPETGYQFLARAENAEDSNAIIRRDTGHMLANGQGAWWYDMDGGWFNDPSIMKAIKESTNAFTKDFADNAATRADVAVFVDEYSFDCINRQNTWNYQNAISEQIRQLNSSGVPYHLYLQSDIDNPDLPQYKLYVFLNAYHLSADQWQSIQKLHNGGKTLCFMHAPGVMSEVLLDAPNATSAISKITGITVIDNNSQNLLLQAAPKSTFGGDDPISYSTSGFTYGHNKTRSPFAAPTFAVMDPQATPLAVYQSNGKIAVAMRDFSNWKSVFYGGIGIDAFFFNALAKAANAWVATPPGNAVYANQHFLTIHALHPGEKKIQLLKPSKVTDLAEGKVLSLNTQTLDIEMKYGETRWFYLQSP